MNRDFIAKYWYANAYEQFETQTKDIEFFLKILREQTDGTPQNILEVACGGGRISVPLAQEGHNVTGFDMDEFRLLHFYRKSKNIPNIKCCQADALNSDWRNDFDVVVMAGNVLINIETEMDYAEAQRIFISKAAAALRSGGHLLLDYDQHTEKSAKNTFNGLGENSYFSGTDDLGTFGRIISWGGAYDAVTRIWSGIGHWELTINNGEQFTYAEKPRHKHIPTLTQVYKWLTDAGLTIEKTYRNYTDEPLSDNETDCVKATIWAKKI